MGKLAPDHGRDQLRAAARVDRVEHGDVAAEAEHGRPVADLVDLVDLVEIMRDVEDGDAFSLQRLDGTQHRARLLARQRRGRLVEDDDARLAVDQRAGDLHQLALGRAEVADEPVAGDLDLQPLAQEGFGAPPHALFVEAERAAGLLPHEHGFGDREMRDEMKFLMDEADAGLVHGLRRDRVQGAPADRDRAGIRLVDAGQDLDDGRLAGAVLADEAVDLARPDLEAGAVEGADTRKGLDDVAQAEGDLDHVRFSRCEAAPAPFGGAGAAGAVSKP